MKRAELDFSAISELMDIRGVGGTAALAQQSHIARPHLYRLMRYPERASLVTVTRLCAALKCRPGDILVLK